MSLRQESLRAYRSLFRAATQTSHECGLYNQTGLTQYVHGRFGQQAAMNKRQLSDAMLSLDEGQAEHLQAAKRGVKASREKLAKLQKQRKKVLKQYQQYVSQQIDDTHELAQMMPQAAGNEPLTSVLQVLSAGVGNIAYQTTMENSFRAFFEFEQRREERRETTEEATSERQNRIMQQAILPYGQRLLLAHRTAIGENNTHSNLTYLTPWQVVESIVGTRSNVTAHHFQLGRDHVVVEIDEAFNKQVVYVCCTRGEGTDTGSYDWSLDVERVEVSESEEIQKALLHSDYLLTASRLCDALMQETPVHPTRKTVLVGHGVGGTAAFLAALILSQRGFEINNTIMFGSPKAALRGTLRERDVAAINVVRVVLAGDPLPELPITGAEGTPFAHVGEVLTLIPAGQPREEEGGKTDTEPYARPTRGDAVEATLTADDLAASLFMDNDAHTSNDAVQHEEGGRAETETRPTASLEQTEVSAKEASTNSGATAFGQVAEKNYSAAFLVEHYIDCLSDPAVSLSYAEGEDDVWDDGDYAQMRSEAAA